MSGDFELTEGEVIRILVGQNAPNNGRLYLSSSGGGGSFVTRSPHNTNESILLIAGGGGGTGLERPTTSDASIETIGQTATGGAGGTDGDGGTTGNTGCGAGGGFFTAGGGDGGGIAYIDGGFGGIINVNYSINGGGFGGGGSITGGANSRYAGGGGYSGGSGSSSGLTAQVTGLNGGGGGSFNSGDDQLNEESAREGHGLVVITRYLPQGCLSTLVPVTATVNPLESPTVSDATVYCGETATLTASGSTGEYIWFEDSEAEDIIESGTTLIIDNLESDTFFYVAASSPWNQQKITFTNCGATGRLGPDQTAVDAEYAGISHLEDNVTVLGEGIQEWIVPYTGTYTIEAFGAQGGNYHCEENLGAVMSGEFDLLAGQKIHVIVGQQGDYYYYGPVNTFGSGGGGTFVVFDEAEDESDILVIAGGGGGYAPIRETAPLAGKTSTAGSAGSGYLHSFPGGIDGNGGEGRGASTTWQGGGGGFYTRGLGGGIFPENGGGGISFLDGGEGGFGAM